MDHRDVYLNYIQGEWKQGGSGQWDANRNPARPVEVLGKCTRSTVIDVDKAVEAATKAQTEWARRPRPQRGAILEKASRIFRNKAEAFAKVITKEQGKNLNEARSEITQTVNFLEYVASEARRPIGQTLPSENPDTMIYTQRVPLGVVGVITPWNFPICAPSAKIASAVLEGNTVVFKPSGLTPASAASLVRVFEEAGLPPGVLNLVYGPGQVVGSAIVKHDKVRAISFTGSRDIGAEVLVEASRRLAKVQVQTGGASPLIVLSDADLEMSVDAAIQGAFSCAGQRSTATSRVLVESSLMDAFTRKLLDKARAIKIGDGMSSPDVMGPLIDENAQNAVLELIEMGKSEGARILCGGERVGIPGPETGFHIAPTVFDQVRPEMQIARREIFGPVLSIIGISGLDDAIRIVNQWDATVATSIYTRDVQRVLSYSSRSEAGVLHVNLPTFANEAHVPFGGIKAAGVGGREMGASGAEFFSEMQAVYVGETSSNVAGSSNSATPAAMTSNPPPSRL